MTPFRICHRFRVLSINEREIRVSGVMVQVRVKRGESVDKALRRLKRIMDKEGTMKQLRGNRYFEKHSERKRKKSARARARVAQDAK